MEINPHRSTSPVPAGTPKKRVSKTKHSLANDASVSFLGSDLLAAIEAGLAALPDVRPERLEEGYQLVEDENYPSPDELLDLSRLALRQSSSDIPEEESTSPESE